MDCGIHAREWIAPAFCQWFVKEVSVFDLLIRVNQPTKYQSRLSYSGAHVSQMVATQLSPEFLLDPSETEFITCFAENGVGFLFSS